jgi:hypothetical protein
LLGAVMPVAKSPITSGRPGERTPPAKSPIGRPAEQERLGHAGGEASVSAVLERQCAKPGRKIALSRTPRVVERGRLHTEASSRLGRRGQRVIVTHSNPPEIELGLRTISSLADLAI